MCGLAGVFSLKDDLADEISEKVKSVENILLHRGPDFQNHREFSKGIIVHTRLAVNDLSTNGNQPFTNESLTLAFNGEVYNFKTLVEKYNLTKEYTFHSQTDFEFLIPLYKEKGLKCLKEIMGIFAFALFDESKEQVTLVRDHLGVKPLYYYFDDDLLIFASEIKAILELVPGGADAYPPSEMQDYFRLGYFHTDRTPFKGIKKLPPGHFLNLNLKTGEKELSRYYELPAKVSSPIEAKEAVVKLGEVLENTYVEQLNADVPIGVMLSGGLDSAILSALYKKHYKGELISFSLSFQEREFNEINYANQLAKKYSDKHVEIPVNPENFRGAFYKSLAHMDTPSGDSSAVPIFLLAERASQDVTVLLSGDGGDEFHGGYDTLKAHQLSEYYKMLPSALREKGIEPFIEKIPDGFKSIGLTNLAKLFFKGASLHPAESYLIWREMVSADLQNQLFKTGSFGRLEKRFKDVFDSYKNDHINSSLTLDAYFHFGDKTQSKTDSQTMAWSLETRVPLADPRLVDFSMALPGHYKFNNLSGKKLLKEVFKDELPQEIIDKKKRGLLVPYANWMREEWADWLDDIFSRAEENLKDELNFSVLQSLWKEHRVGRKDHSRALYCLMSYFEWYDNYILNQKYKEHIVPARKARA